MKTIVDALQDVLFLNKIDEFFPWVLNFCPTKKFYATKILRDKTFSKLKFPR